MPITWGIYTPTGYLNYLWIIYMYAIIGSQAPGTQPMLTLVVVDICSTEHMLVLVAVDIMVCWFWWWLIFVVSNVCVRVLVTCLISNVVTNPCSRPKPTETGGHVIWPSGIAEMPILHSSDCPTMLGKLQFPEPESNSNSRPMDRVALGCHKGS